MCAFQGKREREDFRTTREDLSRGNNSTAKRFTRSAIFSGEHGNGRQLRESITENVEDTDIPERNCRDRCVLRDVTQIYACLLWRYTSNV